MQSAAAYEALVERLDRQFREAPSLYRFKLALLACLGFAVLGGSALFAVGVSAGLVAVLYAISPILLLKLIKVVWIPVLFGWFLLKALWVKFDPPEGYRLRATDAPELVREVERLRRETGAPKLEAILIDSDLNASAASIPRASGLFGHRHYLVLGLPLMQLLSREQLLAVIAHEFGHFGGGHSWFAGWIYRVRVSWYRVLWALQQSGSSLTKVFDRFFRWYAPYFNAYSFSLSRANEFQADAAAAGAVGASNAGAALIRVHLGSDRLERDFWPRIRAANDREPAPPMQLYRDMGAQLRQPAADDAARLSEALAREPGYDDTHPTLAQRLAALGVEASAVPEPDVSAADALLGPLAAELEARFSEDWRASVQGAWEENHRTTLQNAARLAELEALGERDAKQTADYAYLAECLRPELDHVALYRQAVAADPDDAYSLFRLGALLLEKRVAEGVPYVRKAMQMDSSAVDAGAALLAHYYQEIGDHEGLEFTGKALDAAYAARMRVARERGRVTTQDVYAPHALTDEQLDGFRRQVRGLDTIEKAWVVRKHVSDDPNEPPHFVVLVAWRGIIFSEGGNLQRAVDAIELPGSVIVITAPNQRAIARRVRKAAGEPMFVR
jgi:Zn-dependent protease with chaperone function